MSYLATYAVNTAPLAISNYKEINSKTYLPNLFAIHFLNNDDPENLFQIDCPKQFHHYGILHIKRGAGIIKIDLADLKLKNNTIVCLSPGQIMLLNTDAPVEGYFISFAAEFLLLSESYTHSSFFENLFDNKKVIYPDEAIQNELSDILKRMKRELENYSVLQTQILKSLLNYFLIYLSKDLDTGNRQSVADRDTDIVKRFMTLVKKNFLTKKMVAAYARDLCISPNYLNTIVKRISGFTASYHIHQQIILEAKRQAIYSGLTMKEVAYSLGFNDYAHFSKFFKNNTGTNFTCFKNAAQ
jgi:AraC-like DNA-binding protein